MFVKFAILVFVLENFFCACGKMRLMKPIIFCLEDDDAIRELVCYTLNSQDFVAEGFASARDFLSHIKTKKCNLVLLDVMLPEEDGISVLKKMKASATLKNIPVIMTTAKGAEFDKVFALDLGADDYLVKPFGMMEMTSHIKAVLRRSKNMEEVREHLSFEKIEIDKKKHLVSVAGVTVDLTLKEFELLCLLVENEGIVFSREELLEKVWGIDFMGETRTCDVHIGTLRTKLKKSGSLIKTVRGIGYKIDHAK